MTEQSWVIDGHHPVLWSLPVTVSVENESAIELWPAITLRDKERKALSERLTDIGAKHRDGRWELTMFKLRRIGRHAPDGDPESHAVWHRPHLRERHPRTANKAQAAIDEFCDSLFAAGVGESREEVSRWWQTFRNHMLDRLVNKHRPVDLGFVVLHLSLLRADWFDKVRKVIKHPKTGTAAMRRAGDLPKMGTTVKYANNPAFRQLMQWVNFVRLNFDGTCRRRIEVEHPSHWHKMMQKVERHRFKVLKGSGYAEYIIEELRQGVAMAAALLAERRGFDLGASASLLDGCVAGTKILVPAQPLGSLTKTKHGAFVGARKAFVRKNKVPDPGAKRGPLSGMRFVLRSRRERDDMWNCGTYVHGLIRPGGNPRVLVRNGTKDVAWHRELLAMAAL